MENDKDLLQSLEGIRVSGYAELTARGKALYRQKCTELLRDGELRRSFLQSLLVWADCYDRYWKLRKDISTEGETFKTKNKFGDDVVSANPKVKMMNDALKQAQAILKEFGATQKESRKLGKEKPVPKSELDKWMEKNGDAR